MGTAEFEEAWGIGDVIIRGDIVGVINRVDGSYVAVAGSTGKEHTWQKSQCTLIAQRATVLAQMEEAVLHAHS